jgi:hypothetical protein
MMSCWSLYVDIETLMDSSCSGKFVDDCREFLWLCAPNDTEEYMMHTLADHCELRTTKASECVCAPVYVCVVTIYQEAQSNKSL